MKDAHAIGAYEINGIPPGARGTPKIRVTFSVKGRQIQLAAIDEAMGTALPIVAVLMP